MTTTATAGAGLLGLKNMIASRGGFLHLPVTAPTVSGTLERPGQPPHNVTARARGLSLNLWGGDGEVRAELEGNLSCAWHEMSGGERDAILACIRDNLGDPDGYGGEKAAERYAIRLRNLPYITTHGDLSEKDFGRIDEAREAILAARRFPGGEALPLPGDSVEGTYYDGAVAFGAGTLDTPYDWNDPGGITLCAVPFVPFVYPARDRTEGYRLSMSGGPFFGVRPGDLEPAGTAERYFCVWGRDGVSACGSISFPVNVNHWRLREGAC